MFIIKSVCYVMFISHYYVIMIMLSFWYVML